MRINTRLQRLERQREKPVGLTFDARMALFGQIDRWLESHGFQDSLQAIESGAEIPSEMLDEIRFQANYDPRRRAFVKIEAGTATNADVDVFLKIPE